MIRTSNFFVIDNFNTVPIELTKYCDDYIIYDASIEPDIESKLKSYSLKYKRISRTGHNLSTYFTFFQENYENLPDVMCLTKGHMIGRHCSKEFFERNYNNKWFTYLYEDRNKRDASNKNMCFLAMENQYLEVNNSWYVHSPNHPHKYFIDFNDLLQFIYVDPVIPTYVTFAPGGCYIVLREQVLKNTKEFYANLNKIMTYGLNPNFPTEAHMVERMMPIFFEANYQTNPWMNDEMKFDSKLLYEMEKVKKYDIRKRHRIINKIKEVIK